jgi:hypothetical protein
VPLIARYHTKALPDASRHRQFAELNAGRREFVEWLAEYSELQTALTSPYRNAVGRLAYDIDKKVITIHLEATGDCRTEIDEPAEAGPPRTEDRKADRVPMRMMFYWVSVTTCLTGSRLLPSPTHA